MNLLHLLSYAFKAVMLLHSFLRVSLVFSFAFMTVPTIIIAHEFYDALPVHQFQVTVGVMLHFYI